MSTRRCPSCGHTLAVYRAPMESILADVGAEWAVVVPDASRYYRHKLAARYPDYEWRHQRISMFGDRWQVEARRR